MADPSAFKAAGKWDLLIKGIVRVMYGLWEVIEGVIKFFKGQFEVIIGIISGDWEKIKKGFKEMLDGIWLIFKGAIDITLGFLETSLGVVKGIFLTIWQWIKDKIINPIANWFKDLWNGIKTGASNLWVGIKSIFSSVSSWVNKNIITPVKNAVSGLWNGIKSVLNTMISGLNTLIKGINKIKFDVPDWVPKIGGQKWGFNIKEIPKLARGGIVNNPGPGVMMGSYIAGEKGAEAVIPLDDYTLDRLGMAFARHTTINASITNTMNGRVISKELQKINAENDFAYNR